MTDIDYVLKFTNAAQAKADPIFVNNYDAVADAFNAGRISFPTVWRGSQDTVNGNGDVVHTPLAGFFVLITMDRSVSALNNHAKLQVALHRDKLRDRLPGGVVVNNVGGILQDIRLSPVPAGSDYPFGGLS